MTTDLAKLLDLRPIDERARDGKYRLLLHRGQYAVGRWSGESWVFGSGHPLPWDPEEYQPDAQERVQ